MKQRPHAEIIHAWADGAEIQGRPAGSREWKDYADPAFVDSWEYRVKPTRDYPEIDKFPDELREDWRHAVNANNVVAFLNRFLRHAIDHGQVVTREEFDRAVGDRKARDYGIADAVRETCYSIAQGHSMRTGVLDEIDRINLVDLIAKVQP